MEKSNRIKLGSQKVESKSWQEACSKVKKGRKKMHHDPSQQWKLTLIVNFHCSQASDETSKNLPAEVSEISSAFTVHVMPSILDPPMNILSSAHSTG